MITLVSLECDRFKLLREVAIRFPERGSILVEGDNEAGKSTLFEAVHFGLYGRPLVGDLADAIGHGADTATVRLVIAVDQTRIAVERRAQRSAAGAVTSRVRLVVEAPGAEPEVVTAARAAGQRIVLALGGLDSDALLNSCFVEQKKLDRLEQLGGQSLVQSLLKLLNLEQLGRLQQEVRLTAGDAAALDVLRKRLDLAEAVTGTAPLVAARAEATAALRAIALRRHAEAAEATSAERDGLLERRAAVHERAERARVRLVRLEALSRAHAQAEEAARVAGTLVSLGRRRDEAAARAAALDARERDELPVRSATVARLVALDQELRAAGRMREAAAAAARAAAGAQAALARLRDDQREHTALLERCREIEGRLQELDGQFDALGVVERERLPEAQALVASLEAASASLDGLRGHQQRAQLDRERVRDADARLAAAAVATSRRDGVGQQLRELGAEQQREAATREEAAAAVRAHTAAQLFREWARLKEALDAASSEAHRVDDASRRLEETRRARDAQAAAARARQTRLLGGAGAAALGVLVLLAGLVALGPIALLAGALLAVAGGGLAAWTWRDVAAGRRDLSAREAEVAAATRALQEAHVRVELAAGAAASGSSSDSTDAVRRTEGQLAAVARRLHQAGESLPDTPAAAVSGAAGREASAGESAEDAEAKAARAEARLRELEPALARAEATRAELDHQLGVLDPDGARREREAAAAAAGAAEREAEALLLALCAALEPQGVAADEAQVAERLGAARAREQDLRRQVDGGEALQRGRDAAAEEVRRAQGRTQAVADRLAGADEADLQRAETEALAAAARAGEDAERARTALEGACRAAGVAPDAAAIGEALGNARSALRQLEAELGERAPLREQARSAGEEIDRLRVDLLRTGAAVAEPLRRFGAPAAAVPGGEASAGSAAAGGDPTEPHTDWIDPALAWLRDQLDGEDAGALRQELDAAGREEAQLGEAVAYRDRELEDRRTAVETLLREESETGSRSQTAAAPQPLTVTSLAALVPAVGAAHPEREPALAQERERLGQELAVLERRRRDLEAALGVDGTTLDPDEARAALEEAERDREVRLRALDALDAVRRRMVAKVLPSTEANLRLLLPWLTADRYRDARLADDNYRLEVWDDRAGRFLAKTVFSGGTKDQFSLGLRLAFALATLPQELGSTPGFIFLDEPLSSFDVRRTRALVDLITGEGLIARSFAQVVVISHSSTVDGRRFPFHVRMDGGRVAESDLPPFEDATPSLGGAGARATGARALTAAGGAG